MQQTRHDLCSFCGTACPQCEKVGTSERLSHNPDCTACKGECPPRHFWHGSTTDKRKLVTVGLGDSSSEGWYYCAGTGTFETGLRNAQRKIKRTKYQWVKDHKVSRSDNIRRRPISRARFATDTEFLTLNTALVEEPVVVRSGYSETDIRKHTERPAGPDLNDRVSPNSTPEHQTGLLNGDANEMGCIVDDGGGDFFGKLLGADFLIEEDDLLSFGSCGTEPMDSDLYLSGCNQSSPAGNDNDCSISHVMHALHSPRSHCWASDDEASSKLADDSMTECPLRGALLLI
mmetsp:Transcript_24858/g.41557  ORF Transcript_24858/g.41557 Transcript_24858/m.41557 type:complete len:288 (+) Transcript_24858:100-963(+)